MEKLMLNAEYQIKTNFNKQKKHKKIAQSFLDLLKHGEKSEQNHLETKNQKAALKTAGTNKQNPANTTEEIQNSQVYPTIHQTENLKQTKDKLPHNDSLLEITTSNLQTEPKHKFQKNYDDHNKPIRSSLDPIIQGEKSEQNHLETKNQKAALKTAGTNKQNPANTTEEIQNSQVYPTIHQTENLKQTKDKLPHNDSLLEITTSNLQTEPKQRVQKRQGVETNTGLADKDLYFDKKYISKIMDIKFVKEPSEVESKIFHTAREKENEILSINTANFQLQVKNTDEKPQLEKGSQKNQTLSHKEAKNPEKQEIINFDLLRSHNAEGHSRETLKKQLNKEFVIEKSQGSKYTEIKPSKERIDQLAGTNKGLQEGISKQEVALDFSHHVVVETVRANQDIKYTNYHNQDSYTLDTKHELPVELGMAAGDYFTDGKNYSGENANYNHQHGSSSILDTEKVNFQNKLNMSFSFMDTKITVHANSNGMIMHINTSQVIDPSTVEKIRQILLENGFINHNLIVKDRTKTAKVYTTNKAYTENRNSDGFKISA